MIIHIYYAQFNAHIFVVVPYICLSHVYADLISADFISSDWMIHLCWQNMLNEFVISTILLINYGL